MTLATALSTTIYQPKEIDRANGNTRWADATALELAQIDEYETFIDKGVGHDPGPGWKRISVLINCC